MNKCESCYNMECVFVDNQIPFFDSENCQNYRGLTNADRIRAMTDEELAHLLHTAEEHLFSGNLWNYEQWNKWLKAPVEVQE